MDFMAVMVAIVLKIHVEEEAVAIDSAAGGEYLIMVWIQGAPQGEGAGLMTKVAA
jgi:hypothetical protein